MNAGTDPETPGRPGSCGDREVSLPADRSFVVQFRAGSGVDPDGPWAGRVEHVVSGRAARFEDCAGLRAFIAAVLADAGSARAAP